MVAAPEKINVLRFLPPHGDSRYLGTTKGGRNVDLAYLKQVAQAADTLGYYGVLIPTGRSCNTGPFGETIAGDHRPALRAAQS